MQITPLILIPFPFYPNVEKDNKFPYPINEDGPKLYILQQDKFIKTKKETKHEKF
jgi:hypothetical protein